MSESNKSSKWFACYHPRPEAKLRLIGFPHGGGGPQAFREWGNLLPEEIEVVALSLPGRGSRLDEPVITSMDELVTQVVTALTDYFDKPFVFFGHSQGSLAAFEVVRHLEQKGYPLPIHLFVSAYHAPQLTFDGPIFYQLSDEQLLAWIRKLGLVPAEVMEHEELLELILPPIRGDFEIVETYRGWDQQSPISIPMTALGGRDDGLLSEADLQAWSAATTGEVTLQMFDGGHFYTQSHQEQVIPFIAQTISKIIAALPKSVLIAERYPNPGKCFHELFREQAAKTPDQVAIISGERQLTFRELDQQSDLLARYLQSQGALGPVGIYLGTSIEYLVACLSALKAGGPFMQMSLAYPEALLERVLANAEPVFILTNERYFSRLPAAWRKRAFNMDVGWQDTLLTQEIEVPAIVQPTIDSLYHMIFTSGTTGTPKGVISSHRAHFNAMLWYFARYPYQEGERVASNIFLMWETMQPLLNGVPTVIIPDNVIYDPRRLIEFLSEHQITRATFTPSLMEQILNLPQLDLSEKLKHLRMIVWTAEMVTTSLRNRAMARLPHVTFVNEYGLSEIYINCVNDMREVDVVLSPKFTSVGKPVFNNRTYILDEKREPVPMGFTGEIYMAGDSLSYGYLKLPEKTAERFLPDTIVNDGSKMLRTGDAGRILPNGQLEVQGRIDFIVKIRGYRIAPRAIETTIMEHPAVNVAAVTTLDNESGQPEQLVAYIVGEGTNDKALLADMRNYLKDKLPHYAIPAYLIPLTELPIAATGKLDRRKLPKPQDVVIEGAIIKEPPQTKAEKALAEVWQAVLGVESVDATANFFDLGGHSLLAAELVNQLRDSLQLDLSVVDLFQYPTLRALAQSVSEQFGTTSKIEHGLLENNREEHDKLENKTISTSLRSQPTTPQTFLRSQPTNPDIAIIGMACRFPGADNVEQFWENLRDGVGSIHEFTDNELEALGIPASVYNQPDYIKFRGILEDVDQFEPSFWGMSKRQAELLDPQQRLFLESCWQALESAGYPPSEHDSRTGVFGGCDFPWYLLYHLGGGGMLDFIDATMTGVVEFGNDKDYLATRVAHALNLKGPSMTVQTACSTGLVAVATACRALLAGDCDMALAGGVSLIFPQAGYQHVEGLDSPDGCCRPFDAKANGTVLGNGVGVVVIKRLSDAKAAGDPILAVIKGVATNNDGSHKASYTAPSVAGQVDVVSQALAKAGISPDTITYVEAHGTATPIGDPIEVRALTTVWRQATDGVGLTALGSVKANIGHCSNAAGVAGLIKTVLALHHRQIPATLHFTTPNPALQLEQTPFYVNNQLQEWEVPNGVPRRAGVSSLGIGGTNCHIVLEEWADEEEGAKGRGGEGATAHLLTLSAKTANSLEQNRLNLIDYLEKHPDVSLADVAYTLHVGREAFDYRLPITCTDSPSAIQALKRAGKKTHSPTRPLAPLSCPVGAPTRPLVFMFPGGGVQYTQMGLGLYNSVPAYRQHFDACRERLMPLIGEDLGELLYFGENAPSGEALKETLYFQLGTFVVEYALARTLIDWGIQPTALVGHSLGEYVAACLSDILTLDDALKLVVQRSISMDACTTEGAMLVAKMSAHQAKDALEKRAKEAPPETRDAVIGLSLINSPTSVVFGGELEAIRDLQRQLRQREACADEGSIKCRLLNTANRASHSPLQQEAAETLNQKAQEISVQPATIPMTLNLTGGWLAEGQPLAPTYWGQQLTNAVRFEENVRQALQLEPAIMLEVGPKRTLNRLVRDVINYLPSAVGDLPESKASPTARLRAAELGGTDAPAGPLVLPTMRHPLETEMTDEEFLWQTLGQLWAVGVDFDWQAIHAGHSVRRIPLPTYAFDRISCWPKAHVRAQLGPKMDSWQPDPPAVTRYDLHPLLGRRIYSALLKAGEYQFERLLSPPFADYLDQHRIAGKIIFPAPAYLEMALAAGRQVTGEAVVVEDIFFAQVMLLPENEQAIIQTIVKPKSDGYSVEFYSLTMKENKEPSWTLNAYGKVVVMNESEQSVDPSYLGTSLVALRSTFKEKIPTDAFYGYYEDKYQMEYRPTLQMLESLWKDEMGNEALAQIKLPSHWQAEAELFHFHPALMAGFLQVAWAIFFEDENENKVATPNESWIDVSCERLLLFNPPRGNRFVSHARLRSLEENIRVTDIDLYDSKGLHIASAIGFIEQKVSGSAHLEKPWEDWLYEVEWQPQPRPTVEHENCKPQWLILADSRGVGKQLAEQLQELGANCTMVHAKEDAFSENAFGQTGPNKFSIANQPEAFRELLNAIPQVQAVVNLWSLDGAQESLSTESLEQIALKSCGSTLHLVQAILTNEAYQALPTLWLVTEGAQPVNGNCPGLAQAPLWGMARAIKQEQPELNCVCLDLNPESDIESNAQTLFGELIAYREPSGLVEDQIAFRDQTRYVARLSIVKKAEHLTETLSIPMAFDKDSTYLITGGLGGLGLLLAEWMLERGARHLVLVSRSTDKPEAKSQVRQLLESLPDAHDVQITLAQADVSSLAQMEQVLAEINPKWPLAGIIHAAGAYDEALLLDLTWERFIYPFMAKVQGTWTLHQLTREMPLAFFISFSSLASLLENGGQANYSAANAFLDAFGHYRQEQELPALSIAWGAWSQIGSAANPQTMQHVKNMGFGTIAPEEGLEILEAAWRLKSAYLAVSPINWERFATYAARIAPFWAKFVPKPEQKKPQPSAVQLVLSQDEANTDRASLQRQICEQVAQILGIDSSQIDPDQSFLNLGLDSLTSLGLRNRLQKILNCKLPATLIFKYPTVTALVDHLVEEMEAVND